jgi:hypothetical protein
MKLVVCGSSWSSISKMPGFEGTHWSELLTKKLNAALINLAISRASNSNIRLQLDFAKKLKPDFLLFNAEDFGRIDIKILNNTIFKKNIKKYNYKSFIGHKGSSNYLMSTSLTGVDQKLNLNDYIVDAQRQAIYDYYNYIYDDVWKKQTDQYIMNSGILDLHIQNFNFLFNPYLLSDDFELPQSIIEKHFVNEDLNFTNIRNNYPTIKGNDPGYHTALEGQQVIAEKYYTAITNYIEKYKVNIGK